MLLAGSGGWGRLAGSGHGFGSFAGSESDGEEDYSDGEGSPSLASPVKPRCCGDDEDAEMLAELEPVRRAAYEACLAEVESHLARFLRQRPFATFEEWIGELHPENLQVDHSTGEVSVDHRFYAKEGEHRRLWNLRVPFLRQVPARLADSSQVTSPSSACGRGSGAHTPILGRSAFSTPAMGGCCHSFEFLHSPAGRCFHASTGSYFLPPRVRIREPSLDKLKAPPCVRWLGSRDLRLPVPFARAPAGCEWPLVGLAVGLQGLPPPQVLRQLRLPVLVQPQQCYHQKVAMQPQGRPHSAAYWQQWTPQSRHCGAAPAQQRPASASPVRSSAPVRRSSSTMVRPARASCCTRAGYAAWPSSSRRTLAAAAAMGGA